jgi:hypothetical protein
MTVQKTSGGLDFEALRQAIENLDADLLVTSTLTTPRCELSTATPPLAPPRCFTARRTSPSTSATSAAGR